jgi:hypothetical protein
MIAASFAGPAILVAISALLFGIGYIARKSGYLGRKAALGLWVIISVVPLNIAIYWLLLKLMT